MKNLSIVVPCYNEEESLPKTNRELLKLLDNMNINGKIGKDSNICYVDDGSCDSTWSLIEQYSKEDERVTGIKLSRNFGHQNALLAGLFSVDSDFVVSIDADLQDDIHAIVTMLDKVDQGAEIVYGVRDDRTSDSCFKRLTAEFFYKIMQKMGVELIYNCADYRMMSRRSIAALKGFREVNLFLRGIVPLLGFKSASVYYKRQRRLAGTSKYNLRKMLALALNGITSTSIMPLRLVALTGIAVFFLAFILSLGVLFLRFATNRAIPGWASTLLPLCFLGGMQIISIGILGEYMGKLFTEIKARPRYIIAEKCGKKFEMENFYGCCSN